MSETFSQDDLVALVQKAFVASKTSEHNAWSVAEALVQAEVDGQKGHGLSRIASYALQSNAGKVDGFAQPELLERRAGAALVDAANGFAYPAFQIAIDHLETTAKYVGIASAAIAHSHHCGVLGWHVERLAKRGLLAIGLANSPAAMAPWGGKKRLFGTNPIAFAAPQKDAPPVVVDLALSRVARGKILTAAQKGEAIPDDWATDADGNATTDANAALNGTLLPIGDAKGAALAFMVETMAVCLTGSNFAAEASSFFDDKGGPPNVGQVLIAIDPSGFAGTEVFFERFAVLATEFETDPGARLPGTRRLALRDSAAKDGVQVDDEMAQSIRQLAEAA